jgi:hypothetical protein
LRTPAKPSKKPERTRWVTPAPTRRASTANSGRRAINPIQAGQFQSRLIELTPPTRRPCQLGRPRVKASVEIQQASAPQAIIMAVANPTPHGWLTSNKNISAYNGE